MVEKASFMFLLILRIAVPKQQCPLARATVLVPSGPLDASSPKHTPCAIVRRSRLQSVH